MNLVEAVNMFVTVGQPVQRDVWDEHLFVCKPEDDDRLWSYNETTTELVPYVPTVEDINATDWIPVA